MVFGDEIERKKEGLLVALHHNLVHDLPVHVRPPPFIGEAHLSTPEDPKVEIVTLVPDDLFGMRHQHIYLLS